MDTKLEHQYPPPQMKLAQAYVPFQIFKQVLSPKEGLAAGTIFPELIRPYYPKADYWGVFGRDT
ncbi:MAG: spore coat associated protein CotJA [Firmicutes bacterium]|jgi:hypothetical protein|nr:spore coat associated protein CotJA [Bacillota bacterium]HOB22588.1 spore coat associated protein CotJA [Bacillota bacterium]HQD39541.1 spore coat associated protein CotJA [Bacillota bacterium]